jgi:hypothetical protein
MRGRQALTVRIIAAAGIAALGIAALAPRLWAQKPEDRPSTTPAPAPDPKADPLPLPSVADSDPLPPAIAAPAGFTPEGTLADPEGAAKAFVDRSQKEADEAVTALSKEAESLRARLQKVEAGLARWQAVKESLGSTAAARPAWRRRGDEEPRVLEPAAPGRKEAARRRRPGSSPRPPRRPTRPWSRRSPRAWSTPRRPHAGATERRPTTLGITARRGSAQRRGPGGRPGARRRETD